MAEAEIQVRVGDAVNRKMAEKVARHGPELMRAAEKSLVLQVLDQQWKDHLLQLDHLRQGIGLRAYAQRDPLNEYKTEAFNLFQSMLSRFRETVTALLSHVEFQPDPSTAAISRTGPAQSGTTAISSKPNPKINPNSRNPIDPTTWGKVGRNSPCPCDSGKKYKHCHGAVV